MTVSIRFCGGCNPRYDRGEFARRLVRVFPDFEFICNAEESTDAVILLCGCSAACAKVPDTYGVFSRFTVRCEQDWGRVCEFLNSLLI